MRRPFVLQARPAVGGLPCCASAALQEHDGRAQGILKVETGAHWPRGTMETRSTRSRRGLRPAASSRERSTVDTSALPTSCTAKRYFCRRRSGKAGRRTPCARHARASRVGACTDTHLRGVPASATRVHQASRDAKTSCIKADSTGARTNPYLSHSVSETLPISAGHTPRRAPTATVINRRSSPTSFHDKVCIALSRPPAQEYLEDAVHAIVHIHRGDDVAAAPHSLQRGLVQHVCQLRACSAQSSQV